MNRTGLPTLQARLQTWAQGHAPTWPLAVLLLLALVLPAQAQPPEDRKAPSQPVAALARLPHDASAFTQGLILHQGQFYESTGLYGRSELRRVDPATGRVLARQPLAPRLFGEGLALCPTGREAGEARLVQLTWREGLILTYEPGSLRPLSRHRLRGQGWGLACGGEKLVVSDGTDTLRWLNPRTLAETGKSLPVRDGQRRVENLNELEWVNGWLVANIWQEDTIAAIRPDTGQVALWLDISVVRRELPDSAEAANGIAFDPQGDEGRGTLQLTGKRWPTVFVVRLPELLRRPPAPSAP